MVKLRDDLRIHSDVDRFGDPVLVVRDPLVRRLFALPGEAAEIIERLRQGADADELNRVFADEFDAEEIAALLLSLERRFLLETQHPSPEALRRDVVSAHRAEQWEALRRTLERAAAAVPLWRQRFADAGVRIDSIRSPEDFHQLPILTRSALRESDPQGLVPDDMDLEHQLACDRVMTAVSSGSSAGERLQVVFSAATRGLQMAAGAAIHPTVLECFRDPQAVLTSMHCADPFVCVRHQPEMKARIRDGNRLLLVPPAEPAAPTAAEVQRTLDEIRDHGTRWLDGNPTYLAHLTHAALDAGLELPRIAVITCGFEYLSRIHRDLLRRAWGCEVVNRFTASELGNFQLLECERGALHLNDRYYYAEIVRDGRLAAPGELGCLVQSTLHEQIPLLRYQTGDLFVAGEDRPCECGGLGRLVGLVAGRAGDLLAAPDDSLRTTRDVDEAVTQAGGVRFYQLIQTRAAGYRLRIVVDAASDTAAVTERCRESVAAMLGGAPEIRVRATRSIFPEPSGKFRLTGSDLPDLADRVLAS